MAGKVARIRALTVSNAAGGAAQNARLNLYLPKNAVKVIQVPTDCQAGTTSVVCSLGNIAANTPLSRAIVVQVKKPGGLSVSAQVRSDTPDSKPDDNIARSVTAIN